MEQQKQRPKQGRSLTRKIIEAHYVKGSLTPGEEVFLRVDQTLTHDINAVMTYLAFEAIGLPRVRTECSVSYLDHNLLYIDHKTPDDHIYLQSAARKYGVWVSRPGNGICHAVHAARFGVPGKICMGGDSHTPHGGAIGMLCIGVGGMDVATAMTGVPMRLKMPKVVNVRLTGSLRPGVNAKEVILELLRRVSIKGGLGKVYEYTGPGVETLEVPQRATIANMGAEMGATSSIFPADAQVKKFLTAQHRADAYTELLPDPDAVYDEVIELDLSALEPLAACPHQPDNVKPLRLVEKQPVQQVFIGSCTNTSYADVARAALVFRGHHVNENVSCTCGIASRQTYRELMRDGYIDMLLAAGVRMLEIACGPCCAIGQTPATNGIAVRTSNRNFKGRAGNPNAKIYLVSPESAAATAICGTFASAEDVMGPDVAQLAAIHEPEQYLVDDSMLLPPLPPEKSRPGGTRARAEHSAAACAGSTGRPSGSAGQPESRGQCFYRRHHPGQCRIFQHAVQHPADEPLLLPSLRPGLCRTGQSHGQKHPCGRRELWAGVLPRTCSHQPDVSGREVRPCQKHRPHPQGQPGEP